jgi:hypothetical protein
MFWLKGCPRCKGDLYEDTDKYGHYVSCLQCGYHCVQTQEVTPLFLPLVRKQGRRHVPICERLLQ